MPVKSKALNWENEKSNHAVHLNPTDTSYFLAQS